MYNLVQVLWTAFCLVIRVFIIILGPGIVSLKRYKNL
jgi:hypothetical protein